MNEKIYMDMMEAADCLETLGNFLKSFSPRLNLARAYPMIGWAPHSPT